MHSVAIGIDIYLYLVELFVVVVLCCCSLWVFDVFFVVVIVLFSWGSVFVVYVGGGGGYFGGFVCIFVIWKIAYVHPNFKVMLSSSIIKIGSMKQFRRQCY